MKLSELKTILKSISKVEFIFQNGKGIPKHFHVTEVGQISKNFIDCGGTKRNDTVINFQLWTAHDFDHLLSAQKLKTIIELSEKELSLKDYEIEVEYQSETIGKYGDEWYFLTDLHMCRQISPKAKRSIEYYWDQKNKGNTEYNYTHKYHC